jgi:hypothetical protein
MQKPEMAFHLKKWGAVNCRIMIICTNEFREEFTTRCTRTGTLSTTDLASECERGCVWLFKVCRFTSALVSVPSPAMVAPEHRLSNTPHRRCSLFFDQTLHTHPLTRATSPLKARVFLDLSFSRIGTVNTTEPTYLARLSGHAHAKS